MRYDAAGNMTFQADNAKNAARTMAYDSYNRVRRVADEYTGAVRGEYWYDDQGFRVRRLARYVADGDEQDVEVLQPSMYYGVETRRDLLGNVHTDSGFAVNNIYLNGVRIAAVLPNCEAQYYLTDQVDSVKVVTNDAGMVVTSHEYLPFGEDWITEGDTKNAPKYNSQELDKESGYYFYNARHYDPEIGRFVTPDTVIDGENSVQGWNRFAYCHNNPIVYKDPTGHIAPLVIVGAAVAVVIIKEMAKPSSEVYPDELKLPKFDKYKKGYDTLLKKEAGDLPVNINNSKEKDFRDVKEVGKSLFTKATNFKDDLTKFTTNKPNILDIKDIYTGLFDENKRYKENYIKDAHRNVNDKDFIMQKQQFEKKNPYFNTLTDGGITKKIVDDAKFNSKIPYDSKKITIPIKE